ncbi:MAG: hypothetical protein IJC74_08235 [Clostridia bacterium]|nr:hypothetical protein [Clostridia bacterium]
MSLQNKFFNSGLFKNNLKRFKWGSFLYFIILLISGPIAMALEYPYDGYFKHHHIPQFLCAIFAVPVIASVVVYRYLHTRKQVDMFHSLPVSRSAMYITNLLSIITLVFVPVILNGIVTVITAGAMQFNVTYVVISVLWQLFINFVMLSISVVAVMLTGNSFAAIVVTYIINLLPAAYVLLTTGIFTQNLYGYTETGTWSEQFVTHLPMVRYCNLLGTFYSKEVFPNLIGVLEIVITLLIAVVLLAVSYLLYKKRKSETAGEVVAFGILNPIFKVLITFAVSMLGYFAFSANDANMILMAVSVLLITFVVWFALEMVITKSVKVFGKYKGFLAFSVFVIAVCVSIETGGLGYEKRIPEADSIESIICSFGFESRGTEEITNREIISTITELHKSLVDDEEWYSGDEWATEYINERLYVEYKLKNGRTLIRCYNKLSYEREKEYVDKLFSHPEFKPCVYSVYRLERDKVSQINLTTNYGDMNIVMENTDGFYEAILSDIDTLGYKDLRYYAGNNLFRITFLEMVDEGIKEREYMHHLDYITIRSAYKNTIEWLKNNGYYEKINSSLPASITLKKSFTEEEEKQLNEYYMEASSGVTVAIEKMEKGQEIVTITDSDDIAEIIRMRNDGLLVLEEGRDKPGDYILLESPYGTVGYCYYDTAYEVIRKYLTDN